MKPGTMVIPVASTVRVRLPASARTSALVPRAAKREPAIANASTRGSALSIVWTFALRTMRSGSMAANAESGRARRPAAPAAAIPMNSRRDGSRLITRHGDCATAVFVGRQFEGATPLRVRRPQPFSKMRERPSLSAPFSAVAAVLLWSLALSACGSSGNTYTAPSTLTKCAVAFDTPTGTVAADGGSGAIPVKTDRECAWTAEPDVPWLSITAGRSGQGAGTVEFAAAANNDPVARNGGIMLNGSRAQVTQAAAQCQFTLASTSASMSQGGGSSSVDLRASSALCTWTAASDADWLAITSGASGKGSAAVAFTVAPTTGPPRTGTLTIAGLHFSVTQSEGCTFAVAPSSFAAGAAGGSGAVTVTAGPGCPWTAASDVSWVSLTTTSGTGSGSVLFTVAATTGPARSGTVTIAGQVLTVTQSPGCGFDVSPLSHSADASGGTRSV